MTPHPFSRHESVDFNGHVFLRIFTVYFYTVHINFLLVPRHATIRDKVNFYPWHGYRYIYIATHFYILWRIFIRTVVNQSVIAYLLYLTRDAYLYSPNLCATPTFRWLIRPLSVSEETISFISIHYKVYFYKKFNLFLFRTARFIISSDTTHVFAWHDLLRQLAMTVCVSTQVCICEKRLVYMRVTTHRFYAW